MLGVCGNVNPKIVFLGQIAQSVEHPPEKWKVSGSIPLLATSSPSECLHKHAGGFCVFIMHSLCMFVSDLYDKSGDIGIYEGYTAKLCLGLLSRVGEPEFCAIFTNSERKRPLLATLFVKIAH